MQSKITGGPTSFLYKAKILSKYDVSFFKCNETGFIQTEEPYWLEEAYSTAITKLDLGLVQRNLEMAEVSHPLIMKYFDHRASFLDYGGGYGLFTRLMRYRGFDFYCVDKYCDNLFAEFFDLKVNQQKNHFELVTAFEVFEHLPEPMKGIGEILNYSDNLLFSTVIVPKEIPRPGDWWYFSTETGQHVSFYTIESLKYIARKFNKYFYTNGKTIHLFTGKKLRSDPFKQSPGLFILRKFIREVNKLERRINGKKKNLLDRDTEEAKKRISEGK